MPESIKLNEKEEAFCEAYVSGSELADCFYIAYPNDKRTGAKARYRAKQILARPRIQARIKYLRDDGDIDERTSVEFVLEEALRNIKTYPGKPIAMQSLQLIAKHRGVGVDRVIIEDNTQVVEIQDRLWERREARRLGVAQPELLQNIIEDKNVEDVEFEIQFDDDEELEEEEDEEWGI